MVIGQPSTFGQPLTVAQADELIFGYVLLNDWSARDLQTWEYQPLGPFQAKAFATTISAWVVPKAALEPFRVSTPPRERPLLPYLTEPRPLLYDINLEVELQPKGAARATTISRTNCSRNVLFPRPTDRPSRGLRLSDAGRRPRRFGHDFRTGKDSRGSLLELSWRRRANRSNSRPAKAARSWRTATRSP